MTERPDLEQVIADFREQANVLALNGHKAQADSIRGVIDAIVRARGVDEYMAWLSEDEAVSKSAKSSPWRRSRFAGWVDRGLARWDPRRKTKRQYRSLIIPQRANLEAARAQARRDAAA